MCARNIVRSPSRFEKEVEFDDEPKRIGEGRDVVDDSAAEIRRCPPRDPFRDKLHPRLKRGWLILFRPPFRIQRRKSKEEIIGLN
ncbi:hypothetical protein HPP92_027087 [Vanilla planifolia]|uniref:Uncharacterized protein n=1 Tax=Vanilla planifolia TaxID=51239 RepID=A0A835U8I5_VANPL|nr:hypothetical protein HPP92_027087 [Vanilla planifolia]